MGEAEQRYEVSAPASFGRVAVLMGGDSSEREISLMTGQAVLEALVRLGVDCHAVDARGDLARTMLDGGFDRVWNALHGPGGEDGTLQGLLDYLRVPYTGSGVKASALGMDKRRSKQLFIAEGLMTPRFMVLRGPQDFAAAVTELGMPMAVKPNGQGSSVGIARVSHERDLAEAYRAAAAFGDEVLAEEWIEGAEYSAAVVQGEVYPLVRITAAGTFYDYDAKYFSDDTGYQCPAGLADEVESAYATQAMRAFEAVAATGWGRVDFLVDAAGRAMFLEVNTVPGMTGHSLVPMATRARGIEFDELVWRILETSFAGAGAGAGAGGGGGG